MATVDQERPRERVTISDVATALGVAVSTVSNAYNRPDQLSAQLRERVLATAAALGYPGPDPVARGLRRQRAGAVGVLFSERLSYAFSDPATIQVLDGIASALELAGMGLLLIPGRADDPTTVQNAMVDGFIVYSMIEEDPLLTAALRRRLPTVLLDQPPQANAPSIMVDDIGGARQAAAHLLALGHQRFAIITDRLSEDFLAKNEACLPHELSENMFFFSRRRLQGYREALEAAGIAWEQVPIIERPENNQHEGAAAIQTLLAMPERPTAVLCITDRLALGAIQGAQHAGFEVPGNISIIGFDDIPKAALSVPPLTTVRQAHREKGQLAAHALLTRLQGDATTTSTDLAVELIVRGSTAPIS